MSVSLKSSALLLTATLLLSGCLDGTTPSAQPADKSAALMSRAERLAGNSVSKAQLEAARSEGVKLKSIEDTKEGRNFASACDDVYKTTNTSLSGLTSKNAELLAKCSGYLS
ncbi:MAG: hypothetical protein ACU0GG_14125 [Paracoccaceae bacterium]